MTIPPNKPTETQSPPKATASEKEGSKEVSRRVFLQMFGLSAAGLVLAVHFGELPAWAEEPAAPPGLPLTPNAYLRIGRDGKITFIAPRADMGQGIHTSTAQLVAEELDVDPADFKIEHAPPNDPVYGIPSGVQLTGASSSIAGLWLPMRQVGAITRSMLVAAAAKEWKVNPATLRTEKGVVYHDAGKRQAAYGGLVDAVAKMDPPKADVPPRYFFLFDGNTPPTEVRHGVKLKDPKDFKVIGKSIPRIEATEKVKGAPLYGIDVRLPGMLVATVKASPVFGGKLKSVNDAKAMKIKGVQKVVKLENAVAVVADHFWAAKQGLQALEITWDEGPHANVSNADIVRDLAKAAESEGLVIRNEGDPAKGLKGAAKRIDATYELPFLAHATMEPMNCTVHVRPDHCEVWTGTQTPSITQIVAAQVTGLKPEQVTVHNHWLGGGFGRRLEMDVLVQAILIAKNFDRPVKLVWTREEDIQHDLYRPYYYDKVSAGVDKNGKIVGWTHRLVGSSVVARYAPVLILEDKIDPDAMDGVRQYPYDLQNVKVDYVAKEPPGVPTGFWRGVSVGHNTFVQESLMDELAHAAGKDPVEFRKQHLSKDKRAKAVLERVAKEAGWGKPMPAGKGRGIAVSRVWGSYLGMVAEVSVSKAGDVRVERVLCAVDCGIAINPGHVKSQIEGGIIFGLAPVFLDAITIKNGRVEQSNFHDYRLIRMSDTPDIEVFVIDSGEAPSGIGETGTAMVVPAVTNAIFAATGKRLRKIPVKPEELRRTV
ncbi:xanthine dehydrogenase family protein molybdopterin-binding subunit [Nitrospiraceae bacterium HYJII51-Mn-bac16s-1-B09]|uniref:Xanthine dehydrogenase family protein molybdopterin-binding subunit n=2 Tax=Candidatus Manganitrophus noduliformans TaxID=2606439 RepID=A0A7X6IAJ9_9BACT|nr:molybdopterin cofactor-binding domain-containing protein [Candidatus Manganitrophus noduliformans]NKE70796.1 xanthine dehydrogenase family protein molybdopterin-binding subunit [Candidatus Manganitrophus noduliformans]